MDIPTPPTPNAAIAALAGFLRGRLAEVSDTITPLLRPRPNGLEVVTSVRPDSRAVATARQFATVVVGATAPFAPNSYARARLIRQMHATGLLTADEAFRVTAATAVLDGAEGFAGQRTVVDAEVVADRPL